MGVGGTDDYRQPQPQPDAGTALDAVKAAALAATGAREVMLAVADVRAVVTMLPSLLLRCMIWRSAMHLLARLPCSLAYTPFCCTSPTSPQS